MRAPRLMRAARSLPDAKVEVATSLGSALASLWADERIDQVFVIGGGSIYAEAIASEVRAASIHRIFFVP